MTVATTVTQMANTTYTDDLYYLPKEFYIEAVVGEKIEFSLRYFSCNTAKGSGHTLDSLTYQVVDFLENETVDVEMSGRNGSSVYVTVDCIRSVFYHINPLLINTFNTKESPKFVSGTDHFPCQIEVSKIRKFNKFLEGDFSNPSIEIEYNGKKYCTSWLEVKRLNKSLYVPKGWYQSFTMDVTTGSVFVLRVKFRIRKGVEERLWVEKTYFWPQFKEGQKYIECKSDLGHGEILTMKFRRIREISNKFKANYIDKNIENDIKKDKSVDTKQKIVEFPMEGFSPFSSTK
ncbi:hypothetical protein EIN_201840 [Entamoeba invadens IP1]|uniref:Uncharacterized protein n=1 Tax=Entamoeba invadens IP1 TaxID=370355 RepID=A0A0A1U5P1_ENTIV|nr:hypothetical protein EIN_201840 [Entamoeba invadens IP1]ELP89639.1 hypothetical protein EIN_201840 [Entamoeba invadens IP1]|eukprot:XP_004256410.1 hypothetical protein EIN_201840 [Entamoeba invadens IP1]